MARQKATFGKMACGIALLLFQAGYLLYAATTDKLYLPAASYLSTGFAPALILYYLGYFMLGIIGLALFITGCYELASPEKSAITRSKHGYNTFLSIACPVSFGLFVLASWQNGILLTVLNTSEIFLPRPMKIITVLIDSLGNADWSTAGQFTYSPDIADHMISTLEIAILGLLLGSLLGYGVALIATLFRKWGKGGLAIVSVFNAIPIVALAPVMIYWTKLAGISAENGMRGMISKALVVMLVCTATMSVNAYRGLTEVKPFSDDLLKTYASKRSDFFFRLRLPNSIPYIFTALKVSLPLSVITTLVSEYFGDADVALGVGRMIKENINNSQFAVAWIYIVIACLMGILLYVILMFLQGILLKKHQ